MKKGKIADGEARDRLILWIRKRMDEFGITTDALAESIQHDVDHPPIYRDARGNEWNGLGDMPEWLRAASHAGVNAEFFRIEAPTPSPPAILSPASGSRETDPRQLDLFFFGSERKS
ncbi:H-NS family nucleoid-associated regulatory protein [Paraburkholderia sp. XV]|uniref:H-NS family nucleoid-associated regulatory protein n=1 Tax=Paraburkholderia sp. XV TaxID=2831520 RepID=UPI001CD7E8E9|nr:H-NS family nucleoid-associated regulatory protein [Paraburkholderia sp. XV]